MLVNIEQLTELTQNLEVQVNGLVDVRSESETRMLVALAERLSATATKIAKKAGSLQTSPGALEASYKLRAQAQATVEELFGTEHLKNPIIFRRTVALIFNGPSEPEPGLKPKAESKRRSTQRRCERLRKLSPDGLVAWAISFVPTTWSANSMKHDVFEILVNGIKEMNGARAWPQTVLDNLRLLEGSKLKDSLEFSRFLTRIFDLSRHDGGAESRTLQLYDAGSTSIAPTQENREMKHIFTNALASDIYTLPEPFKTAIQNSRMWKDETSQNSSTTSCVCTLFPRDNTQDVSVTLWVGHNEGYKLNDMYGLSLALSS